MVQTRFDHEPTETHGEVTSSELKIIWVDGVQTIEAGEAIMPMALVGPAAVQFAARFAVLEDLRFSRAAFADAETRGPPNYSDVVVRSLVSSGIVAYGRCFGQGVREVRLRADDLVSTTPGFDAELHQYLIDVRDKHVAHSVSAFEQYDPVGILVGNEDGLLRDGHGVGVIQNRSIGASRRILLAALDHLDVIIAAQELLLQKERISVHAIFARDFETGKSFELSPMVRLLDRSAAGKRR